MTQVAALTRQVEEARERLLSGVRGLSPEQAEYKPTPQQWSVNEILEHLVLAERYGISKMWLAAEGARCGKPVWSGEHTNRGLSIEQIVARTWKGKETAPPLATPYMGGPLAYWVESFSLGRILLEKLGGHLEGLDLETVIFPHFLSGPLDLRQRYEFLRFHIDRHHQQIQALL